MGSKVEDNDRFLRHHDITFDSRFFIYIEQNNIQKFTPDGKFHKPEHVAVDNKGGVYVVVDDRGNARMQVFSPCQ